jgi:hypothetical protein
MGFRFKLQKAKGLYRAVKLLLGNGAEDSVEPLPSDAKEGVQRSLLYM